MTTILPELKKGDVIQNPKTGHRLRVFQVKQGVKFDEPTYRLEGKFGVKLKTLYTGEQLAGMGYIVR